MKVRIDGSAFVGKKEYSGVGQYSKLLYEALSKKHKVDLVTGPLKGSLPLIILLNKIYRKLSAMNLALYFDLFYKPAELMIFPNFESWPTIKSKVTAVTIHDLTYIYYPEFIEKKNLSHLKKVIPLSIKRADYIITVSETVKKELVHEFGINARKCIVTHVPPDKIYYKKQTISQNLTKRYGIPNSDYILFVGNLEPRKNLVCLIEAYKKLPQDIKSKHKLVIAGSKGWNLQPLTNQLSREDFKNIILTGFVDKKDMPTLYKMASIFVFPSLYEGFGIPILESMLSGTAVIASDIPVLRETGGEASIYFEPNNADDLSNKIKNLLNNPVTKNRLIESGRENVKRFSWDNNVERLVKLAHPDR